MFENQLGAFTKSLNNFLNKADYGLLANSIDEYVGFIAKNKFGGNFKEANNYIYECACECYDRYYHCYYENEDDEEYIGEEKENDIEYYVEPFNYNNEKHMDILREQENEFWEV